MSLCSNSKRHFLIAAFLCVAPGLVMMPTGAANAAPRKAEAQTPKKKTKAVPPKSRAAKPKTRTAAPAPAVLDPLTELEVISDEALALSNALAANADDTQTRQKLAELALRAARGAERALSRGDDNLFIGYRSQLSKYFAPARPGLEAMAGRDIGAADYALGVFALHGIFEERNVERACVHFAAAFDKGFGGAKLRHAKCIEDKDPVRALTLMREAARMGDASAHNNLGELYESGRGIAKDPAQAFDNYLAAAASGFPLAQFNVGRLYATGSGTKKNLDEARRWLAEAAKAGVPPAQKVLDFINQEAEK